MCDYNSAPQAPVRSNNSLAFPFAFRFLFQKIREPVLSSNKTVEIAHYALEGSAHLPRLPCGFRLYATISEHWTLLTVRSKQCALVFIVYNICKLSCLLGYSFPGISALPAGMQAIPQSTFSSWVSKITQWPLSRTAWEQLCGACKGSGLKGPCILLSSSYGFSLDKRQAH